MQAAAGEVSALMPAFNNILQTANWAESLRPLYTAQ